MLVITAAGGMPARAAHGEAEAPAGFLGVFSSQDGQGAAQRTAGGARISYPGKGRWNYALCPAEAAEPLESWRYGVELKLNRCEDEEELYVCVRLLGEKGEEINAWYGALMPDFSQKGWQRFEREFGVPRRGRKLELRLWGERACDVEVRGATLRRTGSLRGRLAPSAARPATLENKMVRAEIDPRNWSWRVRDRRSGKDWTTFPCDDSLLVTSLEHQDRPGTSTLVAQALYLPALAPLRLTLELAQDAPELLFTSAMDPGVEIPHWAGIFETMPPFCQPGPGHELVVPLGEGFLYPTTDPKLPEQLMPLGQGYALTMDWTGIWDRRTGAAAMWMVEEGADAMARLIYKKSPPGMQAGTVLLQWMPQLGRWGYDRRVRFWFTDKDGYVGLCKRYRREAAARGRLVTLAEKQKNLPQIGNLLGAANGWFFFLKAFPDQAARMEVLRWFHERGMDRLLLSNANSLSDTAEVLSWGWLTSQYDLYSDVWPPETARLINQTRRTFGWPEGIQVTRHHALKRGWVIKKPEGEFPGYVVCSDWHLKWARQHIPTTLAPARMNARFLDTTTALALDECYNPKEPMTRAGDRAARLALLRYVNSLGLLCGSEGGVEWAVPALAYSEGMLSPAFYQHPEAGYLKPGMKPTENTLKYMLNAAVRVPLWELVYHDCTVSYWYWGDANNTFPELWPVRNAFNALYALPPLYFVGGGKEQYLAQRERIVQTDRFLKPVFKHVGFEEMTAHRFLSEDRLVQESAFAGGARLIVNFAREKRAVGDETIVPLSYMLIDKGQTIRPPQNVPAAP